MKVKQYATMSEPWQHFTEYVGMIEIYNRLCAYDFVDRKRFLGQELGKFADSECSQHQNASGI